MYESKAGERGIFSRVAAQKIAARNGRRDPEQDFGTNPCSEIILRSNQFCNLSEVVVRADDTVESLKKKVEICYDHWHTTVYLDGLQILEKHLEKEY